MTPHLRFFWSLLRHKAFVFRAGLDTGVSLWRLVIHDYTKFLPCEWAPYVRRFQGGRGGAFDKANDPDDFHRAWTHHWHRNPHHWEYWLAFKGDGSYFPMEMPFKFVREMVADWMGAGRAYTGTWDPTAWYEKNRERIVLHPTSRAYAELLISTRRLGR